MRDLVAYVEGAHTNHLPEATSVAAPLMDTRTGSVVEGHLDVFDPSLLLQGLGAYDEFDHIMRTDLVETFWAGVKADDPKLRYLLSEQPGLEREDLNQIIPLFLHGDKAEYVNDDSIMI